MLATVAGPDVPVGKVSRMSVSLVDCFPSVVEAVEAEPTLPDAGLPGRSLFQLGLLSGAGGIQRVPRDLFELWRLHGARGAAQIRALRQFHGARGPPPPLFDLEEDPDERRDLGREPAYDEVRAACERALYATSDPGGPPRARGSGSTYRGRGQEGLAYRHRSAHRVHATPGSGLERCHVAVTTKHYLVPSTSATLCSSGAGSPGRAGLVDRPPGRHPQVSRRMCRCSLEGLSPREMIDCG